MARETLYTFIGIVLYIGFSGHLSFGHALPHLAISGFQIQYRSASRLHSPFTCPCAHGQFPSLLGRGKAKLLL